MGEFCEVGTTTETTEPTTHLLTLPDNHVNQETVRLREERTPKLPLQFMLALEYLSLH